MFVGHFAVGFAAKRYAPRTSLAVLLAASLLSDLLWPIFLLLGWEVVRIDPNGMKLAAFDFVSYPWSHSLLVCLAWATLFAAIYYSITGYSKGTVAVALGVLSHWVLDWITHKPDMPLYPGSKTFGLGLWNLVNTTVIIELSMFAVGVVFYLSATRPLNRVGRYAFWAYVAALLLSYLQSSFSGKPPHNVTTEVAWPGLILGALMILWAWWFDRNRVSQQSEESQS
ncbi:metal-dependent hydrolase [Occallatibacter riparius]|uniref:Metal-dependent hydrolase n=1 Tax=Occallatibacter riparius TaxID=1002689 RepID=A0A9J7BKZ9_9BACT|nr:metal-dependent hydrolase [Occallatibacter riparius]UWZ83121.1 metal-dependent hydrolase [Occallatibacter riparius]